MQAKEIMNKFFVSLLPIDPIRAAVEAMTNERVGLVCVCDTARTPVGLLTDRDIVTRGCFQRRDFDCEPIATIMTRDPLLCSPNDEMDEVEQQMKRRSVSRVLVADSGELVGVITLAEIWHSESPLKAGAVSRRVTERELRVEATGGHYDAGRSATSKEVE